MWIQVPITINDVTLREWDQAPLTSFVREEKMLIAAMLEELWIDNIEAWFAVSRADYENIEWVFEIVDEEWPIIATLWRAVEMDTKASINVVKWYKNSRIHIFLATSDEHIKAKFENKAPTLKEMREWLLEQIDSEVWRAKEYKDIHNEKLEIEFSPEDATGNALTKREDGKKYLDFDSDQFNFLIEACELAIRKWATIINTPDTLGNFLPHQTEAFFQELSKRLAHLKQEWFQFELSAHIHNDLWMASANAIAAIRWGATQIEVTINGIGERAGNTTLHEIIGLIGEKWHNILDEWEVTISPKIKTQLVWPISEFVRRILNLNKELQKPFIGGLSDIDGSWVHNAAKEVYGETKNKAKYGWARMPEFFSPRWGTNQIVSMLSHFWIAESPKSQLIWAVTMRSCEKAEQVKALYERNIYSMYMKEAWDVKISNIDIQWKSISATMIVSWKEIIISWTWEWENWAIDGLVKWINEFLWKEIVDIESIEIVNKPTIRDAYERFETEVSQTWVELSQSFKEKMINIVGVDNSNENSRQLWVAHTKLIVDGKEVSSVNSANNIDYAIAKAIIDGSLPEIVRKIDS